MSQGRLRPLAQSWRPGKRSSSLSLPAPSGLETDLDASQILTMLFPEAKPGLSVIPWSTRRWRWGPRRRGKEGGLSTTLERNKLGSALVLWQVESCPQPLLCDPP